ncbi:MAG: tetratricopeptide repeat protein, partial [Pseudomonadota bacterium]|nr:tetratricopeptide repeat protein [Pseudomonadota bacterium]
LIFILFTIILVIFFSFYNKKDNFFINRKKYSRLLIISVIFIVICSIMYLKLSNYWLGNTILEKITLQTNINNKEANQIALINKALEGLEKEIEENPENIEAILKLAETKFLLGNIEEALTLVANTRKKLPNNLDIINSEVKIRVIKENDNLSEMTLELTNKLLFLDPENRLALYILGNDAYLKKDFSKAYKLFSTLKVLLKEGTAEYNEIYKKILDIENKNAKSD